MVVVQINYRRPDMPKAEWDARYSAETAAPFVSLPGLQWKIWLDGEEERRAGGIYLFADDTSAHAYADMHTKRLESFGVTGIRAKFFDVNEALTSVTRGPIS